MESLIARHDTFARINSAQPVARCGSSRYKRMKRLVAGQTWHGTSLPGLPHATHARTVVCTSVTLFFFFPLSLHQATNGNLLSNVPPMPSLTRSTKPTTVPTLYSGCFPHRPPINIESHHLSSLTPPLALNFNSCSPLLLQLLTYYLQVTNLNQCQGVLLCLLLSQRQAVCSLFIAVVVVYSFNLRNIS